jgi:hypothetical protein
LWQQGVTLGLTQKAMADAAGVTDIMVNRALKEAQP